MRINENNYVDKAEKVIKELAEESKQRNRGRVDMVTTSKLRNLLAMTADIYNQVLTWQSETLSDELTEEIVRTFIERIVIEEKVLRQMLAG